VRILAPGLLAPAPARVAEDVDVGRPDGQAAILGRAAVGRDASRRTWRGTRWRWCRRPVDHRRVPGGGHADRLGEHRGLAGPGHAVQALAPPVVGRHRQARDGGRGVLQLAGLLLQRHGRDQGGGAGLGLQGRIEERRGRLGAGVPATARARARPAATTSARLDGLIAEAFTRFPSSRDLCKVVSYRRDTGVRGHLDTGLARGQRKGTGTSQGRPKVLAGQPGQASPKQGQQPRPQRPQQHGRRDQHQQAAPAQPTHGLGGDQRQGQQARAATPTAVPRPSRAAATRRGAACQRMRPLVRRSDAIRLGPSPPARRRRPLEAFIGGACR
jgi:hypothetical protein